MSDTDTEQAPPADANALADAIANADALGAIALALMERGHAPEGEFKIDAATIAALDKLGDRAKRLDTELAVAIAERDALKAKLDAAEKAPRVKAAAGVKGRKISASAVKDPIEGRQDGERVVSGGEALLEAIGEAGDVQVVFSDGKTELTALEPRRIEGNAWRNGIAGVQLTIPELLVHGNGIGRGALTIAGYGLLLDGKLAAYRERIEPLVLAAGSTFNLAPDIVF